MTPDELHEPAPALPWLRSSTAALAIAGAGAWLFGVLMLAYGDVPDDLRVYLLEAVKVIGVILTTFAATQLKVTR